MFNTKKMKCGFTATIIFSTLLMLTACQTVPQLTDMQKRQITTQDFNGSYDNILVATQSVIQDHQYVISQIDKDAGLIVAQKTNDNAQTQRTFLGMPVTVTSSSSSGFSNNGFSNGFSDNSLNTVNTNVLSLSATITPITKTSSEVRISIQEQGLNTRGGIVTSNQIYDQQTFQNLFSEIGVEIQRREAIQGN